MTLQCRIILALYLVGLFSCTAKPQVAYDARIAEEEVLTPIPGSEPQINGPKIYGARPGRKFVYRIPCQGERPISFSIKDIPSGLTYDSTTGIITGTVPMAQGVYNMKITAKNNDGKVTRDFALHVGDKIALTPPTGWNTWGGHMINVSDELIRKTADVFVQEGLADVGFQYISIDDCWMKVEPEIYDSFNKKTREKYEGFDYTGIIGEVRDKHGNIQTNIHFPDMKALCDYVHASGLKIGIYSGPGRNTCQKFEASLGYEKQDADQWAAWGFDLIKYDLCSGGKELKSFQNADSTYTQAQYWKPMVDYIYNQDRDILFNLCQYGEEDPWVWAPDLGIQSWRTGGDLNHHVDTYFEQALWLATDLREYSGPGHWNDPDFLYIHKIRDFRKMANPTIEIPLNTNQRYQYVTLWSIINAPFFFSCNINEIDEFTLRLLGNANVLNINQDELGQVGRVVRNKNNEVIIVKNLANGSKAVAIFNRGDLDTTISFTWNEIDACCEQEVFDVWRNIDLGVYKGGMAVQLSGDGVAYLILKEN